MCNITITINVGDNYRAACLLDYFYFKEIYNNFPKDLSKQQAFNADTKAIQQFSFTVNLDGGGDIVMF